MGTAHRVNEDNLLYLVTKVYRQRRSGFIVADRVLILSDGSTHTTPDNFPIHIRDVEILTREYEKEKPKPDLRCNLSHFVIDTEKSDIVSSEHVLQDNSEQDMSCNLTSSSSIEDVYQTSHHCLNLKP